MRPTHWQARLPFFYGWVIVGVVFLQNFIAAGSIWAVGVLSVPMHSDLGWSRATIFAGVTLLTLGDALAGVILGKYIDLSGGPRLLGMLSGVMEAATLFLVAFVQEPWQFLLVFGFVGGFLGMGPAFLMVAVVPKWFVRRRGRAVATATMGTGLAAFVLPPLVTLISEASGWRATFAVMGGLAVLLALIPSLLLKTQPEEIGLHPDGDADEPFAGGQAGLRRNQEVSFTAGEAFGTSTLWLLIAAAVCANVSPTAYPTNLVSVYVDRGFSTTTAAAAFSAYGLFSFGSRFFWGYLADHLDIRAVLLIITIYSGIALPILLVLPGNSALVAGALAGFGIGGWVGLGQLVWVEYFGRANLGSIIGMAEPLVILSAATGPLYVAALADVFGGYELSIGIMALSWWLSAFFLLLVRPPRLPPRLQIASRSGTLSVLVQKDALDQDE